MCGRYRDRPRRTWWSPEARSHTDVPSVVVAAKRYPLGLKSRAFGQQWPDSVERSRPVDGLRRSIPVFVPTARIEPSGL